MKGDVTPIKLAATACLLVVLLTMDDEAHAVGIWGQVNITLPGPSTTPAVLPVDLDEHPKTEPLVPPPPHFIPSSSHVPLKRKRPPADPSTTSLPTSSTSTSAMTPVGGPALLTKTWDTYIISNGTSYTLECAFEHIGNASVTWSRNGEILAIDRSMMQQSRLLLRTVIAVALLAAVASGRRKEGNPCRLVDFINLAEGSCAPPCVPFFNFKVCQGPGPLGCGIGEVCCFVDGHPFVSYACGIPRRH